ncbi:SRPBCC family protein [Dactylosporangium aurantiacum]|uniref:SRPBCC family protein n=1 Tax=Dactylosporangium aurantiacum TaxID=35754 RepID=A0A9Q9MNH9_9ACTN|nr:SRPBCC family protein [Dactylosporangium aurantiacum]UWZ55737.1 SRPBCC family protein [Dactylosporangium aurantiacum]
MEVVERVTVAVAPEVVFRAVSDVRRMAKWSPECFATWVVSRSAGGVPRRFVGFNRHRAYVWFTTCRVVVAEPGAEFAFDVTTFGLPVARWGFRLAAVDGGTGVTQYWIDRRVKGSMILGRIFTGKVATERPEANREGMRVTLGRLKRELEAAG